MKTKSSKYTLLEYYCIDCGMVFASGDKCPRCHSYRLSHTMTSTKRDDDDDTLSASERYLQDVFATTEKMEISEAICFCGRPQMHRMVYPKKGDERLTSLPFCPFRVRTFSEIIDIPDDIILDRTGVKDGLRETLSELEE